MVSVGHDALDEQAVEKHAREVADKAGSIDVSLNAIAITHVQGIPLAELALADFALPISTYTRTHFLTATAVARRMVKQGSGVILTLSTPAARMASSVSAGFGVACAAVEGLSRQLAGELGPHGIRVICLRPDGIPEASRLGSHSREVFSRRAERMGNTLEQFLDAFSDGTLLKRSPTLAEVANVAVFMASDQASGMTGTVANVTCGSIVD